MYAVLVGHPGFDDGQRHGAALLVGDRTMTWYNHVNVPTWNYQSVHVYGKPRIITEYDEAYDVLKRLVNRYETGSHYNMETLPQDFVEKEIKGIVAFQIEVTRVEANYKLSQNRKDEDHANIITHQTTVRSAPGDTTMVSVLTARSGTVGSVRRPYREGQ